MEESKKKIEELVEKKDEGEREKELEPKRKPGANEEAEENRTSKVNTT